LYKSGFCRVTQIHRIRAVPGSAGFALDASGVMQKPYQLQHAYTHQMHHLPVFIASLELRQPGSPARCTDLPLQRGPPNAGIDVLRKDTGEAVRR
jgi:hypothetical protein